MKPIHPVVAWGAGWTAGLVLTIAGITIALALRTAWAFSLVSWIVGLAVLGFPMLTGARRSASAHPAAQAAIWVIGFAAAVAVLIYHAAPEMAAPGTLNINTTETMQRRQQYFDAFGRSPEDVFEMLYRFLVLAAFSAGCGLLSGVTATWPRRSLARLAQATAFGVITGLAFAMGLSLTVVGVYLLGAALAWAGPTLADWVFPPVLVLIAGFSAGCVVGSVVEWARRALLRPAGGL
jgi:hypothetical protein